MTGTCSTCVAWVMESTKTAMWAGRCDNDCMQRSDPYNGMPAQRNGIVFEDINRGGATFHTGPLFGCIHWMPLSEATR